MKRLLLPFILFPTLVTAQQHKVEVREEGTGSPVASADVFFPDTRSGVATDVHGVFTTSSARLLVQISHVGYKTLIATVESDTTFYLTPSHFDLQEVVVSASSSRLQGENVLNVERLSLVGKVGTSLAQRLSDVAGISNYSTGGGIGKPVVRGLSGNRVAVYAQGIRIENQQWGDEHGLGLDDNGYEQVEIIKGPASLLYGSDALGGVLYFTDERYAKRNSVEGVLHSEYHSNTNGTRTNGAFKWSGERLHVNVFGGYTTHGDYHGGDNEAIENSYFHAADAKVVMGYSGDNFSSSVKYSFLDETYGLYDADEEPFQRLATHILNSENTIFLPRNAKIKLSGGVVVNRRREFEEPAGAALDMNLATCSYNAVWQSPRWGRWLFSAGSQGMFQANSNGGEEELVPDAHTTDVGLFSVVEYYYAAKSYLQIGARIDGRFITSEPLTRDYTAFNFSLGVFQSLPHNMSVRGSLSSGFRAPNMFELLSDGVHEGTFRYEIGSPSLHTENSYQIDVALRYTGTHVELFVNPFANYIRNFIHLVPTGTEQDDMPVFNYIQTDALLYGGEAGFHFHPHSWDWLHVEGAYSSVFGEKTDTKTPLPLIPAQKVSITVRANVDKFSFHIQNSYTFNQPRIASYETATQGYNLVNAGVSFSCRFAELSLTANNLFNTRHTDHLSRYKPFGLLNMGRNIVASLTVKL